MKKYQIKLFKINSKIKKIMILINNNKLIVINKYFILNLK